MISGTAGNVEHGDQYQLRLVYEHNLQRTACNMTYGPFGGVTGERFASDSILACSSAKGSRLSCVEKCPWQVSRFYVFVNLANLFTVYDKVWLIYAVRYFGSSSNRDELINEHILWSFRCMKCDYKWIKITACSSLLNSKIGLPGSFALLEDGK